MHGGVSFTVRMPSRFPVPRAAAASRRDAALASAAVCAWFALSGAAARAEPAPAERSTVSTVVAGIVGYTRWPADAASLRLCTFGRGTGVDALLGGELLGSTPRPVSVQALPLDGDPVGSCDALYVGTLATDAMRRVVRRASGHPVLTIGEGGEFCSDGGMFCLHGGARFAANLDAIARSGLRVNPMVLRLARGTGVAS